MLTQKPCGSECLKTVLFRYLPGSHFLHRAVELPAVVQHNDDGPDDGQHAGAQERQGLRDGGRNILDVVGHSAHHVSVGMSVQITNGKIYVFPEQLSAHLFHQPLTARTSTRQPLPFRKTKNIFALSLPALTATRRIPTPSSQRSYNGISLENKKESRQSPKNGGFGGIFQIFSRYI